jgi:Tol biopolymer transport system component
MLLGDKSSRPATLVATALALAMAGSSIAKFGQAFESRIAFIQGPDIFSMNPDGSDVRQLTFLGANNSAFFENWSPDGRQLVFAEYPKNGNPSNAQLWLMDGDGSNQHLLLSEAEHGGNAPSFSPDGAWVIFSRCESPPSINGCAIYKIQRDGSDLTAVTNFSPLAGDWDPVYSPDGMTIAFTSYGREGLFSAIWLMNPDSSNIRRLTPPELSGGVPQWSPDGDQIAFRTHCCNPQNADIWVINRDGSGLHRLTGSTTSDHDIPVAYVNEAPSWSPHGHAVVFDQFLPSTSAAGIFIVNADGSAMTQVMKLPFQRPRVNRRLSNEESHRHKHRHDGPHEIETGGVWPRWSPELH